MQERLLQSFSARTLLRTSFRASASALARALTQALAGTWGQATSICRPGVVASQPVPEPAETHDLELLTHELRAPVSGILGMCELLQKSELTGEQFQLAGAVEESGRQLLRIIARFGPDKPDVIESRQLRMCAVNGPVLMEQVIRAHWPAANRKGIGLFLLYDHRLPTRWQTDIACLRQLLDNLLGNAIKFTDHGHVLVEVRPLHANSPGGTDVELAVSDTGIGIARRDALKIYSIREQGGGKIAERFGGSGLGLYVCNRMASLLGGCITHESPGVGTTCFRVRLPGLAEPGTERFDRLQPGLLRSLKCLLAIGPPRAEVLEHLLLRIGVQLTVNEAPRNGRIPAGMDVMIYDQVLLRDKIGMGLDVLPPERMLLLSHRYAPHRVPGDDVPGVVAMELPQPLVRSNLEPVLLRVALLKKLHGARSTG